MHSDPGFRTQNPPKFQGSGGSELLVGSGPNGSPIGNHSPGAPGHEAMEKPLEGNPE